jgi:hypothetical protein
MIGKKPLTYGDPKIDRLLDRMIPPPDQELAAIQGQAATMIGWDESSKLTLERMKLIAERMNHSVAPKPIVQTKILSDYSNADLVMEMIRRGFAVMKLPEGGGPPEALRGTTD